MRILGLDWGERRLGFAVSDESGLLATPLDTAAVESQDRALLEVEQFIARTGAGKLVVGLPLNMDGTHGLAARKVEEFAAKLRARLGIPVETWDERLTTAMAERAMLEADLSRAKRKKSRDRLAAQIILQGYLDAMNRDALE
ncbi:MAG: Holliday junction resolvase RuvX [Verrucomicrobiota bacterium]|nr:Holliday junction resolvase RuvX [Verrucomicrobiota bacterium]